jgi:hypothetical protein
MGRRGGTITPQQPAMNLKRPEGAGIFILPGLGNLILDQKFHSEWETR